MIIPTLNEEEVLKRSIEHVRKGVSNDVVDIVVADGGSKDRTIHIAQSLGARVVKAGPGRGGQMDRAAELATTETLLFLHADTLLPEGWYDAIKRALEDRYTVAGGFTLSIDSDRFAARLVEWGAAQRARLLGLVYGDQAIFIRTHVFKKTGGFRGLPLLEDVDLMRRVRQLGRVAILKQRVLSSSRRWQKRGYMVTTIHNWLCLALYHTGVSPQRLYRWYYKT